jgi:hypothetical protein
MLGRGVNKMEAYSVRRLSVQAVQNVVAVARDLEIWLFFKVHMTTPYIYHHPSIQGTAQHTAATC